MKSRKILIGVILAILGFGVFLVIPFEVQVEKSKDLLVVAPLLTANAYKQGGYYSFFGGECDESCLTVHIDNSIRFGYTSSNNALVMFDRMGVEIIDDYTISQNPEILDQYKSVVLLHNEYVPIEFYDSITTHQQVFYMYPNALYGMIEIEDDSMTLIRGHNYPEKKDKNGFDWPYENTHPDKYDLDCIDFEWRTVNNGYQLNCYPELAILNNPDIINFIMER